MKITQEQYEVACEQSKQAQEVINLFHKQKQEAFNEKYEKYKKNELNFTDEDLIYSAHKLCPCGHGLAYPKECGPGHHWDCSAILKDIADKENKVKHTAQLPFAYYSVISEDSPRANGITTRGIFKPQVKEK